MSEAFEKLKSTKKKNIVFIAASALIFLIAVGFFVWNTMFNVKLGTPDKNNGNIVNGGFVTEAGDSIVLCVMPSTFTYSEGTALPEQGIIVMDKDGSNTRPLTQEYGTYLSYDGTWLYYSNVFDGGKLYRVHLDGTQKTTVTDFPVSNIFARKDKVFFHNDRDFTIEYITADMSAARTIAKDVYGTEMNISGERLYYLSGETVRSVCSVKLDGSDAKTHIDIGGGHSFMITKKGCFIIIEGNLYRLDLAAKKYKLIKENVKSFNIDGDTLYFVSPDDKYLYKCPLSNTDAVTKTSVYDCNSVGIANGQVFTPAYDVIYRLEEGGYATYGRYKSINEAN